MSHSSIAQYGPAITWVTSSTVMPSSNVVWAIDGSIATLTFNRPQAKNALTWDMYDALVDACDYVDATPENRVLIIRGRGGAFAAGTDIAQFTAFTTGHDGIAYERRLDAVIERLERVSRITIAAVDGAAVGGGCAIALACDLRVCSSRARFGVPVARTLGNCLSAANLARLVDAVGVGRARDLMFSARLIDAAEAAALGLARLTADDRFDQELYALAADLSTRAPSTVQATKALLQHIREHRLPPPADDIVARCYGSEEFREGVRAFVEGRAPRWSP
jgi:enoyl-CoA hydratase/carnithine racemase